MRGYYLRTLILLALGVSLLFPSLASSKNNLYTDQVAVIVYHHIHEKDKSPMTITPELMKSQLNYLLRQGYHFITLAQFERFLAGDDVPPNAVLVTFDDGYESYIHNAYPILKKRHIPAVNFIITETLDNPHGWKLPFLSREEIRQMADKDGLFQFQSHSRALHSKTAKGEPYLTTRLTVQGNPETENQYRQRIVADMKRSVQDLSELNHGPVQFYAYPYGAFNKEIIQLFLEGGMRYAFTVVSEMTTRDTDPMQIPRINAGGPYMTPQNLHNAIMRRVVETDHINKKLPLRQTVAQLGGDITRDQENNLRIILPKITASAKSGSNQAIVNGNTVSLGQPIEKISKKNYIDLYDLEKIVGSRIVYLTNAQRYAVRVTPSANP